MSTQTTIFDAIAEAEARDRGMDLAAAHAYPLLELARNIARRHATQCYTVTIEDVRSGLDLVLGPRCWESGNWMGSVFRGREWEPTGRWVQTTHKGGHARRVAEWRLKCQSE